MSINQKRINGPDVTTPYSIYLNLNSNSTKSSIKNELQTRDDNRKHYDFRKMCKYI
jgi:hypothetical protein